MSNFDVGGSRAGTQTGFSAFGYSGQVRVQVDGVNTTEGTGAAGFYYDYGSFQELQLTGDGMDASASTPGVQLNAVVKSGGNKFKGDFYYDYENKHLQGNNVTDELRRVGVTEGTRILLYRDPNVSLGGPILRDKLWFFTSFRDQRTGTTVDGFPVEQPGGFFFETRLTNVTYKINYQLSQNNRLGHYIQWGRKFQPQPRRRQHGVLRRAVPPGQLVVGGEPRLERRDRQQVPSQRPLLDVRLRLAQLPVRHQRRGQ